MSTAFQPGDLPAPWTADQRLPEEALRLVRAFADRPTPDADGVSLDHLDAVPRIRDHDVIDDAGRYAVGLGSRDVVDWAIRLRHREWDAPGAVVQS